MGSLEKALSQSTSKISKTMRRVAIYFVCLVLFANMVKMVPIPDPNPVVGKAAMAVANGALALGKASIKVIPKVSPNIAKSAGALGAASHHVIGKGSQNAGEFGEKLVAEGIEHISGAPINPLKTNDAIGHVVEPFKP